MNDPSTTTPWRLAFVPRSKALFLLAALAFVGCDASTDDTADATANEDAAASIANALALDSGGALDDVAEASVVTAEDEPGRTGDDNPFCDRARSYNEVTMTWTSTVACERGNPDGRFYALFSRTRTHQFIGADGQPQMEREGAVSKNVVLVDGEGIRRAPRFTHELLDIGGAWTVDDLDQELVTVNGDYNRSATDTLRTRNRTRTLVYDLALTFDDVRGPRGTRQDWHQAVSGTLSGTYDAFVTFDGPRGYSETEIHRTFSITFGEGDSAGIATIRVGGDTFRANLATGELL